MHSRTAIFSFTASVNVFFSFLLEKNNVFFSKLGTTEVDRLYKFSHHCTEVSFITSPGNIVHILPTGAQPGVHVGHLPLHQLQTDENKTLLITLKSNYVFKLYSFTLEVLNLMKHIF